MEVKYLLIEKIAKILKGKTTQKDIFKILDCSKKIGLTLTDSLLMSPTKSVTAIVGIKDEL